MEGVGEYQGFMEGHMRHGIGRM
jgi:hypothetical protein